MRLKISVLFFAAALLIPTAQAQTIKIKGSTALLPVEERWALAYAKAHPGANIIALGGGTTVGINALAEGTTDCASASRPISEAESHRMKTPPAEYMVASDAILFIVNPGNPVKTLTLQQVADIYTGKTTNWSQVGGENLPIHALAPDANYGTHSIVRERVLGGKPFSLAVRVAASEHELMATVWQDRSAISFSGIALGKDFPHLAIAKDKSSAPYSASAENLHAGRYPLMHSIHMYCSASNGAVKDFMSWVMSAGQQSVEQNGLLAANRKR